MTQDFRTLLKEISREPDGERWFEDIRVGDWFYLSPQASAYHECQPRETLPDPMAYATFEVQISNIHGVISYGKWGVWEELSAKPWAKRFSRQKPTLMVASDVPAAVVQEIYEDLSDYARSHPVP